MLDNIAEQYSVLIAVYKNDNPEWFDFALESMIKQTKAPAQIVIVEDGPLTEDLNQVIETKCNDNPCLIDTVKLEVNKGLGSALREGIKHCKYEWVFRMDADDYSAPDRCEKQLAAAKIMNADIIGSDVNEFIDTPDNVVARRVFPESHEELYRFGKRRTPFAHPAVLMRKSQVLAAGNYCDSYMHEDFDLFARMLSKGYIAYNIKEPLTSVRVSSDFYNRRGGYKYLKTLLKFNCKLLRSGWMGMTDFMVRSCANTVFCLMPNRLRSRLYREVLRR